MRTETRSKRRRSWRVEPLETRQVLSTIYVSPTGSDAGPGTANAPYLTLQKAANVAVAGDTVDVRAGNYGGFVLGWDTPKSGTSTAPITFKGEPGATIIGRNNKTPDGIDLERASWITIEGFKVVNMPRTGIRSTNGDHVVIRDNVCDGNGYWGIFTSFDSNLLIQGNTTSNSVRQHGIYVSNSAVNPTIRDNIVFGNAECGIHMNGDASQGGSGIITGGLVEGNIIHDNGHKGGSGINMDGVQNSVVRDNLLYNNHASGISLYRIDGGGSSTNDVVIDNTIVMASDAKFPLNIQNASTGTQVFDNVLLSFSTKKAASYSVSADSLPGLTADNNAVMGLASVDGGNTLISLAAWRTKTGQDAHSIQTTPTTLGFVNLNANDYHLAAGSAAINAGRTSLPTLAKAALPTIDLGGLVRVQGQDIDIGAYESAASPWNPPLPPGSPTPAGAPPIAPTPAAPPVVTPIPVHWSSLTAPASGQIHSSSRPVVASGQSLWSRHS